MYTLLLRLQGPMQSWGTTSHFSDRDSQLEPSKSGVIGLVAAALGIDRSANIDHLTALRMGVRVDREGVLSRDFHTAGNIISAAGSSGRSSIGQRLYLADAVFLVGLEGEDKNLLSNIHEALKSPRWPLFLGRKSFPATAPIFLPDGLREVGLEESLRSYPSLLGEDTLRTGPNELRTLRFLLESTNHQGKMRLDQPVGSFADRQFQARYVETQYFNGEAYVSQ